MLFGMSRGHLIVGFMLVSLNLLVMMNNVLKLIPSHVVICMLAVHVMVVIYLVRLGAQNDKRQGFLAFASFFIVPYFLALVIYPLELHPNQVDYTYRKEDTFLLWGLFVAFMCLVPMMLRSVRHTRSLKAEKRYMQTLYRSIIEEIPIPIGVYKRQQREPIVTNQTARDMVLLQSFTETQTSQEVQEHPLRVMQHFVASLWTKLEQNPKKHGDIYFERHNTNDGTNLFEIGYGLLDLSSADESILKQTHDDHLLVFGTEIGERAQLVQQLTQAKEVAEQSDKTKSAFLANVSHELRTPITSIVGFSQLIRVHEELPPDIAESVDIITRSGENLLALVNDVLDLSKAEANSLSLQEKYVDINTLIYEEIRSLHVQTEAKQLPVNLHVSLSLSQQLYLDEGKVRQIFRNLLSNAIKFTDEGSVTIYVWSSQILTWQEPPAAFTLLSADCIEKIKKKTAAIPVPEDNVMLHMEVRDTGKGISAEELTTIFDPFTQSRSGISSKQGTGLGLSICKKYAEFLGGDLRLESHENQGTLCHFYIPVRLTS